MPNLLAILLIASAFCAISAPLAPAPELSKEDATVLLAVMGYKNVIVGAVVNGAGGIAFGGLISSPSVAFVRAYAERDGKPSEQAPTFSYDKDLGWYHLEIDTDGRRVRLWTKEGYKELRPEAP